MMLTLTADYDEDNIDDYDRLMELSEGGQETAWNDYHFDMVSFPNSRFQFIRGSCVWLDDWSKTNGLLTFRLDYIGSWPVLPT